MRTGLTVGKFAPLHKGHQYLIETALTEVDQLIVIVYEADQVTKIPIEKRMAWIRALYPEVIVIAGHGVPKDSGYTHEIQMKHVDFIKSLIKGYSIDVFFSSEPYGDLMSRILACENRLVDYNRQQIPISGTFLRLNPETVKAYVPSVVYEDLILYREI
ncbi:adenylyltransferase/cytidyltransferase family protein [Fusibacter tunisiensis]|uniref:Cytidyltransferase-like protein n=1 Tax=Fusibacter tunisiensis TaxID=1008308 RepID=A0ABS2MQY8_9FIRM|nr:adenylyltransferase/cytidyltransferase family protein [Fusibacter tunisiensis]MBM7561737.1 cytidyltransferase-like protein [Fusibacter tunisiensis]